MHTGMKTLSSKLPWEAAMPTATSLPMTCTATMVTALNPYIGYENAAKTAKKAYKENISLKEACVALGFLTAEKFDEVFHPEQMA